MFSQKTKDTIKQVVSDYIKLFPQEYAELVYVVNEMRKNHQTEFAEVRRTHAIKRALYIMSDRLDTMLQEALTPEEWEQISLKENARWIAKEFPQFALTKV